MIKDLKAGDPVVVGPYKLLGRLGAGGMGQVYLAKSPGGRLVAIKLIRPELAEERGFRARFTGEIAAARNVSGIYTAAVVDADTDAELPWMATVYVPGPSLTDAVEDNGPLPVKTVLALAAGLAEALEAIHRAGLVHRDMKPSNVLLAADGPRVIDFGISRALERSMMTTTGMVLGSPGFMSPEQAMGEQVGKPSDVFSLGAILAYAATGAGPFGTGPTPALLYRVVREDADLSKVPGRLRPLIEQCLAKDPASRPTPSALLSALGDEVEVITGEWLPQAVAEAMNRYSPTLQTPLPPSLREPDSAPVDPVPAGAAAGAGLDAVVAAAAEPPTPAAGSPVPSGPVPATPPPATPAPVVPVPLAPAVTQLAATTPPATALAATTPPATALAAISPAATTPPAAGPRAEYNLPETSLVAMAGAAAGHDLLAGTGSSAGTGGNAGTGGRPPGPAAPVGPPRRRRRRWPLAAAAAALVVIVVAAALVLTRSPGSAPKNGPRPSASLAGDLTNAPSSAASHSAAASKTPGKPHASTSTGTAPDGQPVIAPAHSSSASPTWTPTPTTTASPTWTPTPTTSPTTSPTTTPTSTPTSTPTTTAPTSTATATTTTSAPTTPVATGT